MNDARARHHHARPHHRPGSPRRPGWVAAAAGTALVLGGCEIDSFLDLKSDGRFEVTPTTYPVLDRLSAIEGPANEGIEYSRIMPEDLIAMPAAYRLGPGDVLTIEIQDFTQSGVADRLERDVDPRGYIDLPRMPSIRVLDKTVDQAQVAIADAIRTAQLIDNPMVSVRVVVRRQLTYNVIGGVANPGAFAIARPDFRLLDALAQAGRFNENIQYVYVIRAVNLSDRVTGREPIVIAPPPTGPSGPTGVTGPTGATGPVVPTGPRDNIIDLIDELSKPTPAPAPPPPPPAPGTPPSHALMNPAQPPEPGMQPDTPGGATGPTGGTGVPPPIDIPDGAQPMPPANGQPEVAPYPPASEGPDWVFLGGQWVRAGRRNLQQGVGTAMPGPAGVAMLPPPNAAADLFTQRVIRIEVGPLMAGSAQHNIIIRPGDVIRVPSPSEGLIYVAGEVARPGPYNIPSSGRLTALRSITAAGGFSQTAVPWRAEIVRMVGPDRQAIMRIDLAAIKEGTQPDIFMKPDDQLVVGTNFWAYPLAIIRSGFRASYGFGFILDRNFGPDAFGERRFGGN